MKTQRCNKSMMSSLDKRFLDLWQRCQIPHRASITESVYQSLCLRYNESNRYYHDLNHLIHCLEQLDLVSHLIPDPVAVEMALWFHDAVYKPGRTDNEQKSAELFLYKADTCFPDDFKHKVKNLILVTSHKDAPQNEDESFIVDIDLSSFGSDWNNFLIDTGNLRKEQRNVPDPAYFQTHTRFLRLLTERERIFQSDFFYERYEHIALQNINRLLAKRKSQGYT